MATTRLRHGCRFPDDRRAPVTVVATASWASSPTSGTSTTSRTTVAGYAMGVFAVAHVLLNQDRLIAHGRFRWRSLRQPRPLALVPVPPGRSAPERDVEPAQPAGHRPVARLPARPVRADRRRGRRHRPRPWPAPGTADRGGRRWASSITNGANPGSSTRSARLLTGAYLALYKRYPEADIVGLPRPDLEVDLDNRGDRASAIDPRPIPPRR